MSILKHKILVLEKAFCQHGMPPIQILTDMCFVQGRVHVLYAVWMGLVLDLNNDQSIQEFEHSSLLPTTSCEEFLDSHSYHKSAAGV